jgi:hypothetical protein
MRVRDRGDNKEMIANIYIKNIVTNSVKGSTIDTATKVIKDTPQG